MAFFDKLNDFAKNIGDMTSDAIEGGKLTSKVNSEKNLAGEELKKIGEYYYKLFESGEEPAAEVAEFYSNAKAHFAASAEAQAEIDRMKAENEAAKAAAAQQAAAAQAAAAEQAAAAQAAAVAQATEQPAAPAEGLVCSICGTVNAPGTRFCGNCGNKLEEPAPAAEPAPRFCANCGAALAEGIKFCPQCGQKAE